MVCKSLGRIPRNCIFQLANQIFMTSLYSREASPFHVTMISATCKRFYRYNQEWRETFGFCKCRILPSQLRSHWYPLGIAALPWFSNVSWRCPMRVLLHVLCVHYHCSLQRCRLRSRKCKVHPSSWLFQHHLRSSAIQALTQGQSQQLPSSNLVGE